MRKKDHNITPFIYLSPRLNNQTMGGDRTKILQRSWTTVRVKYVQLGSHQQCAQGYCKHHRLGEDRINHNVPNYDRNCIDAKDKQRRGDPERIGDSGSRCRRGNPLDSGQEDDNKSTRLGGLQEQVKER